MSTTGDSTYTPKSPDLSSFYSGPEVSRLNHYAYPSSVTSAPAGAYPLQPPAQTQVQTPVQRPFETGSHNFSQPPPHYPYQSHHYNNTSRASTGSAVTTTINNHSAYHLPPQEHPHFAYNNSNNKNNSQHSLSPYPHQSGAQYYPPPRQQQPQYSPPQSSSYPSQATSSYYFSYTDSPNSTSYLPTNQDPQQHLHQQQQTQTQPQQPPLVFDSPTTPNTNSAMPRGKAAAQVAKAPEIMESPVRTKFPTARIKRIMQADEEVGKVAQQTPIAVGKALELFMVQLVHKSAEVAKDKNSKRITAPMLKQAIDSTNEWDFLREIVAKVTEEKEGGRGSGRAKVESESDDDADAGEVKKKGRGGRKKKAAA